MFVYPCPFVSRKPVGQSRASHLDTQEVAKADLSDIVTDVLIVLKVSTGDVGCARKLGGIRLVGVRG